MSFIDEVCANFYDSQQTVLPGFRAFLYGDSGVYVEGVLSMLSYDPEQIEFIIKGGRIKVTGQRLYIKKYCGGDVVISGKISGVIKE